MNGEIIKSFLVSLGFGVDESSLSKFNKSISEASLKVAALGTAIEGTAIAIGYGIADISKNFEDIGYQFHIIAPAINKALVLRREILRAYSLAGINITRVIQNSVKLNYSLAKTGFAFKAIYDSVGSRFFGLITKQSDVLREKLYKNLPKIQNTLEHLINFVFKAFEATTTLGSRLFEVLGHVYDFFVRLDEKTDGWSTIILGLVAAWRLLNLGFLATPLGMLIAGFTALLALWDDFKTFREGGQSLINWGSQMTKTMVGLAAAVAGVATAFYAWRIISTVTALLAGLNVPLALTTLLTTILEAPLWLIVGALTALGAALVYVDSKWNLFGGKLAGLFGFLGGKVLDFLGGSNVGNNLQNSNGGLPRSNPIGSGAQNSNTNQNVTLQSQTNINGTADANALSQLSSSQQKNNAMLVRNLRGLVQPSN